MSDDIRRYIDLLAEAQVFDWVRFKPAILNYITKKLKGEGVFGDPFYDLITNRPQVGASQRLGFDDKLANAWHDYFSKFNSNGVWSQFDINHSLPRKSQNRTYNYYITVAKERKNIQAFISGIPKLFEILKKLSDAKQTPISFKTHQILDSFIDHNDSLKVYYYDPALQQDIEQAVKEWLTTAGVKAASRTHTHGVDIKDQDGGGSSFGQLLANQVTRQLDAIIAKYGNKYTAEQYYEWINKNMDGIIKSVQVNRT